MSEPDYEEVGRQFGRWLREIRALDPDACGYEVRIMVDGARVRLSYKGVISAATTGRGVSGLEANEV